MNRICTLAERRARSCLRERAGTLPGLSARLQQDGADAVHDMRVACRRTRVALAEFGPQLSPTVRRKLRESLREIRKALGPLREIDVHLEVLEAFEDTHPAVFAYAASRLQDERAMALDRAFAREFRTGEVSWGPLLTDIERALRTTTECYRKQAERRLKGRLKSLVNQHRAWKKTSDSDDLHAVRIELKKLRYTLEVYIDLYGAEGTALLGEIGFAQDKLGEWNDHRNLARHLLRYRDEAPAELLAEFTSLLDDMARITQARLDAGSRAVRALLNKVNRGRMKELFAKPQRPCCDKRDE